MTFEPLTAYFLLPDPFRPCIMSEIPTSTVEASSISVEMALISGGTRVLSKP